MSADDLINLCEQKISKWPLSGHFKLCNIYLTQEMQNDFFIYFLFLLLLFISEILHDS